jgi:Tol biopolymer transport system component
MSLTQAGFNLWVLPLFGDTKPIPFLQTEFHERNGQFSPDLRWMAYDSDESGKTEVYVRTFPSSDGKSRISTGGGSDPKWSHDGKELFYIAPDWKLMAVSVKEGGRFEVGTPRALFQTHLAKPYLCGEYAVARDGQRFLMPIGRATSVPFTVVMNWTAGLKQ